jgi:carbon-monoxide dehydrogenase iron sulfur subunit
MKRIVANTAKCLGCRTCEWACALAHAGTDDLVKAVFVQGSKPRIYIEAAGGFAVPLQCRHCDDAPCVSVCPSGALSRKRDGEPVAVNQGKCIGCAYCVEACPFGVIVLAQCSSPDSPETGRVVIKCDLCASRLAEGLEPACVSSCPVHALLFQEVDVCAKRSRALTAARAAAAESAGAAPRPLPGAAQLT